MNITQASATLPVQEDAFFTSSMIRPMLVRPYFMKESELLLHVPFLFWLMDTLRPTRSMVIGTGDGLAYLTICQAIEEFSIRGRCSGFSFQKDVENGDRPRRRAGTFDDHAETLYEGRADLHFRATPAEAFSDIQPCSMDLLFLDLGECERNGMSDPKDWMEKLAPSGCLVVHGLGEIDDVMMSLKSKVEAIPGQTLLFFDLGTGLAVVLKDSVLADLEGAFITLDGNGCYHKADSLLLRRLGQGLAAIARNGAIARSLDTLQEEYVADRERHAKAEKDLATLAEAYEARNRKIWELQATNFDRENENRNLQKHQQTLSDAVSTLKEALEAIQKEKNSIAETLTERLREEKDSHYRETGILTKLLEQKNDAKQSELKMLRRQIKELSDHNHALLASTSWRITAPMRKIKMALTGK